MAAIWERRMKGRRSEGDQEGQGKKVSLVTVRTRSRRRSRRGGGGKRRRGEEEADVGQ
jgi:hypothetical protein